MHPDAEIKVSIDSVRKVTDTVDVEDGSAVIVPPPIGAPGSSKYVAVHVKQSDGHWLPDSVRDTQIEIPSTYYNLQHLELLVGDWSAEHAGVQAEMSCSGNLQKSFLERHFVVTRDGKLVSSSTELIGWDPLTKQVTLWSFASDGGRSVGKWTALVDGLVVQSRGITADGIPTISVDTWAPLLDGALGWRSTNRSAGGEPLKNSRHVVLKKKYSRASSSY